MNGVLVCRPASVRCTRYPSTRGPGTRVPAGVYCQAGQAEAGRASLPSLAGLRQPEVPSRAAGPPARFASSCSRVLATFLECQGSRLNNYSYYTMANPNEDDLPLSGSTFGVRLDVRGVELSDVITRGWVFSRCQSLSAVEAMARGRGVGAGGAPLSGALPCESGRCHKWLQLFFTTAFSD
eukprot:18868-Rhodomonas_salina.2